MKVAGAKYVGQNVLVQDVLEQDNRTSCPRTGSPRTGHFSSWHAFQAAVGERDHFPWPVAKAAHSGPKSKSWMRPYFLVDCWASICYCDKAVSWAIGIFASRGNL